MGTIRWPGRFFGRPLRVVVAGLVVVGLLAVALVVAGWWYVRQAGPRITVDSKALAETIHEVLTVTLREGDPGQKLEAIAAVEELPPADRLPYVPALTESANDDDPEVRRAATKALGRIDADAAR